MNVLGPVENSLSVFGGGPGAGSDTLNLEADPDGTNDVIISPLAGASDDQLIEGLGTADITSNGVELITLTGDGDDTLTVNPGSGDHIVRVDDAATVPVDRVTSDSLPQIEFGGLATFIVSPSGLGNDVVTFVTRNLTGAAAYEAILDSRDTLVIEGSDGTGDDYTVLLPATGSVEVADAAGITVTETSGNLGRLLINTLGGDDEVTVDVDSAIPSDVIAVPITFDGGAGSDALTVQGDPTTTVGEVIYTPGPATEEGRLTYEDAGDVTLMTIDFVNLEPVVDLVVANKLTVNGTNADNAINYGPGSATDRRLVSVDAFETIEFANKTTLALNGLAGR